jgi:hypothetical protein
LFLSLYTPRADWERGDNMFKLRSQFTDRLMKLKEIPAEQRKTWFASPAYSFYLGDKSTTNDYELELSKITPETNLEDWSIKMKKKQFDIVIFDLATSELLSRYVGEKGIKILKSNMLQTCYETRDKSDFGEVFLRKRNCIP